MADTALVAELRRRSSDDLSMGPAVNADDRPCTTCLRRTTARRRAGQSAGGDPRVGWPRPPRDPVDTTAAMRSAPIVARRIGLDLDVMRA